MFKEKRYYGEFLEADEKISTNILADRLKKLEAAGLITKSLDEENHAKYIYGLTPKGIDLMPMLLEMIAWGAKYDQDTEAPPEFIRRFKSNRETLMQEILKKLK